MPELSVIILSYNTKEVTENCLNFLIKGLSRQKIDSEIIVVDNASTDGSGEMLLEYAKENQKPNLRFEIILNRKNLGYPSGNNQGIKVAQGEFVLLLNSDAYTDREINWRELFKKLREKKENGVLTVRVILKNGEMDPASHRGFPTIWRSFTYFTGLEKLFSKLPILNRFFGGYHLTHLDLNQAHEIDSPSGAFFLAKKEVLDRVGGFDDKNFFLYGEDLDLSYRIKQFGYKVIYFPKYEVTHLKGASGVKKKNVEVQKKAKNYFYESMKVFYRKHYEKKYPAFVNNLIYFAIDLKKKFS